MSILKTFRTNICTLFNKKPVADLQPKQNEKDALDFKKREESRKNLMESLYDNEAFNKRLDNRLLEYFKESEPKLAPELENFLENGGRVFNCQTFFSYTGQKDKGMKP